MAPMGVVRIWLLLGARIGRDGGREAGDGRGVEGSRARRGGECVVDVAVEDVQLLPERLVHTNEDLIVVVDVGHGGSQ